MPWLSRDRVRLEHFRDGDRATLAETYRVYAPGLAKALASAPRLRNLRLNQANLLSPSDLDDLLQETFVRAFAPNARLAYDGIRPFRNFLFVIAANLAVDRLHQQDRHAARFSGLNIETIENIEIDLAASGMENPQTPEEQAMNLELRQTLADFKKHLDVEQCRLFELRFEEGLPRHLIATQIGLTDMKVRKREERLRQTLLQHMRSRGFDPRSEVGLILCVLVIGRLYPWA